MLEIKKISKIYKTFNLKQKALNEVSINFRKSEFVTILGPSGSGKSTLLNIIGGLDKSDSGELIINGINTKKYKDTYWDNYRNHRVGFVFQNYNLIMHETVLRNVELPLILSKVTKKERIKKAKEILKKLGLENHYKKKPYQLSGGQMQRVGIARALVNNPDIILADEPTGALDSETSEQIMIILKEIAKEKLVIMVTHNKELANKYSTRIVNLKDGKIISDSNSYEARTADYSNLKMKKTSINFVTTLLLSLNNLKTKKGRTFLTALASSIGIIGIALILSLSSGVNKYIKETERETLSTYPITIEKETLNVSEIVNGFSNNKASDCPKNNVCTIDDISNLLTSSSNSSVAKNNLESFKKAIDSNFQNINSYKNYINYDYELNLQVYNLNNTQVATPTSLTKEKSNNLFKFNANQNLYFKELVNNPDLLDEQYKLIKGRLPKKYDEIVLVVDQNNQVPLSMMYMLGYEKKENLLSQINDVDKIKNTKINPINYNINELIGKSYKLVLNTDYYFKESEIWKKKSLNQENLNEIINEGLDISIVGIIKLTDNSVEMNSFVGYTKLLTDYIISGVNNSKIVKEQLLAKNKDIFTNQLFVGEKTYKDNLKTLGYIDINNPNRIDIYPKNYESKEKIELIIQKYNDKQLAENKIMYIDYVKTLMSSITKIVNIITYILIAFVAISLIVSSIMISIITYISVLERTKEIGILRSIGASKNDIARVFKSETMIEGFAAGVIGIIGAMMLNIPINLIVNSLIQIKTIAKLPIYGGILLVIISVLLTLIAGLIPARTASKKDPVISLRNE